MKSKSILVIDDDEVVIKLVESTLKKYQFEVLTATDGQSGIETAKTHHPDAILLDRNMPELNGNETLKILKKDINTANIPVLMLTGDNNIAEVAKSLELGADDYIVKPFNPENLLARLKNVIR